MASFKTGNILNSNADIYCFTANSIVKRNGELVMGAGVAKAFYNRSASLARECADLITTTCGSGGEFNLIQPRENILALQTKLDWKHPSPIDVVTRTIQKLHEFATDNPDKQIAITYLGTLNGGLDHTLIHNKLKTLPDNITVWSI